MNDTQRREKPVDTRDGTNADLEKWADAINNLLRIIERSERQLEYFQNRVKQARFRERPNQRKVRTAGSQIGVHSTQLGILRNELRQLERLYGGGVRLRQVEQHELRQIWGWINRPGIRNLLYTARVPFDTFLQDWHRWCVGTEMYALAIEIRTTDLLIGFTLLEYTADTVTVKFVIIRPDHRARGYGTDALSETTRYAFEGLGAEHITLQVSADNYPALICFENAGFQYLSYAQAADRVYTMGIERSKWEGNKAIDELDVPPPLSVPLRIFFDPQK